MRKTKVILTVLLVVALVAGCSGDWRPKLPQLPTRSPVDVFLGIIDQVKNIGRSLSRRMRSMGPGRN